MILAELVVADLARPIRVQYLEDGHLGDSKDTV